MVLAQHPELAENIRTALNENGFRVVHRTSWEEAEPLLAHGLAQACLIDADLTGVQTIWLIEKVRRTLPRLPILVCSSTVPWELEEEAYLKGVQHVLYKPIRARLFNAVLAQVFGEAAPAPQPAAPAAPSFDTARSTEDAAARAASAATLEVLRDYSCILTHSLNAEGLLKQFLLFLRETLGVNRAAIFLRQPEAAFGGALASPDGRRLRSACAIGLASGLLEHFELSFDTGIGGQVFRLGRIVRRNSEETRADIETQKEFELLGAQVAVPILDRETVVGLAVFDGRVTGEPLVNAELDAILPQIERYRQVLAGRSAAIYVGGAFKAFSLVRALRLLGMRTLLVGSQTGTGEDYEQLRELCDEGTIIVDDSNPLELASFLRETQVDLFIGGVKERPIAYKLGVGFCDHNHERKEALAGFAGMVNFAREVHATVMSPVWKLTPRYARLRAGEERLA